MRGNRLHPLWRVALFILLLLVTEVVIQILVGLAYFPYLLQVPPSALEEMLQTGSFHLPSWLLVLQGALRFGLTLVVAVLLGRRVDKEPDETMGLELRGVGLNSLIGVGLGLATMFSIGGLLLAFRWTSLDRGTAGVISFLVNAVALLLLAAAEEVAFRGYLQRATVSWRGPAIGVAASAVLFALFHGLNPNVGLLGLVNIFLAGVVFGLAVEWTGTLWLATAYHFVWNLVQGPVLGLPVSGIAWEGFLALQPGGPPLWSGGSFGPEGGLLATLVLLASLLPMWFLSRRPASVATGCRRQRAAIETLYGPLPHTHFRLEVQSRFFPDIARAPRVGRIGEVVLVMRRSDGRLLLHTKTFYPDGTYRLPSGGIQQAEPVLVAVRREMAEETGLSASEVRPLGLLTYTLRLGWKRAFFHSWVIQADVEGEPTVTDVDERIEGFRWVEPEELRQMASELRALPGDWNSWGRFRAAVHDAAVNWLTAS
jgi:membrane protease YdiL (CAAX protease family)/8-oxo-dGTP pyrophosphatase MutT (NUDIX family)